MATKSQPNPADKEAFEELFQNTFVPLEYEMVKEQFEELAKEYGREIFTEEYLGRGKITKKDYIIYMNSNAYLEFEAIVEEAMDALNQDIVDVISEIANDLDFDNDNASIYYDQMEKTLKECLDRLYDSTLFRIS